MYSLNELIGIPFENKARGKSKCDCMGLAIMAHESFGVEIPDFNVDAFSDEQINGAFVGELENSRWKKIKTPEAPCVVTMALDTDYPDMVTHIGTYIGDGKILHTHKGKTSYAFRLDHPFFKNKILGYYKYE